MERKNLAVPDKSERHLLFAASLCAEAVLLIAIVTSPSFAFFQVLRIIVSGAAAYIASKANSSALIAIQCLMVAVAILFNPILPVHLTRTLWRFIDFGAVLLFGVAYWKLKSLRDAAGAIQ